MAKTWALIMSVLMCVAFGSVALVQAAGEEKFSLNDAGGDRATPVQPDELRKKATQKQFPGGLDEGDLQVQASLPSPNRGAESVESTTSQTTETEKLPAND